MFLLRRATYRVVTTPITPTPFKCRSITTFRPSILAINRPTSILPFQRRFASEEITQAEPEADGATEAEHGRNSIANSTTSNDTEHVPESADPENHSSVASAISSAAATVSTKASEATEAAAGAVSSFTQHGSDSGASTKQAIREKNLPSEPTTNLYMGNLAFEVTEEKLKREMEKFGEVQSVRLITDGRGLSRGFGYVTFVHQSDATKVLENLNQQLFEGRRLSLGYANHSIRSAYREPGIPTPPSKTLFIGNMSFELTDQDLNDLFRNIRDVVDVRVAIDRRTGQPRGFAHADFLNVEGAQKAKEILEQKVVAGRKLRVDFSRSSSAVNSTFPTRDRENSQES